MSEFVFILGKNAALSEAELENYLKVRGAGFSKEDSGEGFIIVRAEKLPPKMMEGLGGTLKIGEVLCACDGPDIEEISKEIGRKVDLEKLFAALPQKALFAVSAYGQQKDHVILSEFFKRKMKERDIKAGYVHLEGGALSHTDVLKKRLAEKGMEFLACRGKRFWLAKTAAVHDPFEFRRSDERRVGKEC